MPDRAVSGVLLAAGPSTRFGPGPPKQLAPIAGEPMVRRAARRALEARLLEVIAVVGYAAGPVRRALEGLPLRVVENPAFAEGQSTSVRAGVAALGAAPGAALFVPCDQPGLTASLLDRMIAAWRETGAPIVVPVHEGRRGAPVLFDRALFGELAGLTGDAGGRQLFAAHQAEILELEVASAEALRDVDDRADLDDLTGGGR